MKDMANVYRKRSSDELRLLRSKKIVRLEKCAGFCDGYFNRKEMIILAHQIHQIDVELTCRFQQQALF